MRDAGFLESEIDYWDRATDPSGKPQPNIFDTDVFQQMIRSRAAWTKRLEEEGLSPRERIRRVNEHYQKLKAKPDVFIKAEYQPAKKRKPTESDFIKHVTSRVAIKKAFGEDYHFRTPTSTLKEAERRRREINIYHRWQERYYQLPPEQRSALVVGLSKLTGHSRRTVRKLLAQAREEARK